ncbi:MAG: HNH endonuclease signature motif containing protein [Gemmatales bacterium]
MSDISRLLKEQVIKRAGNRCEYCLLSQVAQEATFHVDHVIPRVLGGPTSLDNLALACVSCSLRKWAKETAIDPNTGQAVPLYNPRAHRWGDHFRWSADIVIPLTNTGRATVSSLAMNRSIMLSIRHEEATRGRHPPPSNDIETPK